VNGNLYDLIGLPLRVEAQAELRLPDSPGAGQEESAAQDPRGSAGRCQFEIYVNFIVFVYFEFYLPRQHHHYNHPDNFEN